MATYNPGSGYTKTSKYGYRINPETGAGSTHRGEDYSAPTGTPIPAAADGKVYYSGELPGYGNVIVLEHNILTWTPPALPSPWAGSPQTPASYTHLNADEAINDDTELYGDDAKLKNGQSAVFPH